MLPPPSQQVYNYGAVTKLLDCFLHTVLTTINMTDPKSPSPGQQTRTDEGFNAHSHKKFDDHTESETPTASVVRAASTSTSNDNAHMEQVSKTSPADVIYSSSWEQERIYTADEKDNR